MRRMYGDFRSTQFQEPPRPTRRKRSSSQQQQQQQQIDDHHLPGIPDITAPFNKKLDLFVADDDTISGGDSYFGKMRKKRQSKLNKSNQRDSSSSSRPSANPNPSTESSSGR